MDTSILMVISMLCCFSGLSRTISAGTATPGPVSYVMCLRFDYIQVMQCCNIRSCIVQVSHGDFSLVSQTVWMNRPQRLNGKDTTLYHATHIFQMPDADVYFKTQHQLGAGQKLVLSGDIPELGCWHEDYAIHAVQLEPVGEGLHLVIIKLPMNKSLQWKWAIADDGRSNTVKI